VAFDPDGVPGSGDEYNCSTLEKYGPGGGLLWTMEFRGGDAWWNGGLAMSPDEQVVYTCTRGGGPGQRGGVGPVYPMGGLTAVDANTGVYLWTVYNFAGDGTATIGDHFGSPVVDVGGYVYAVTAHGVFYSTDSAGNIVFAIEDPVNPWPHSQQWASPMITMEGVVITVGDEGNIIAWDPAFGPVDVDGNGVVDGLDLTAVITAWMTTPGAALWSPYADLDGNGVVDGLDLTEVIANWSAAPSGAAEESEPAKPGKRLGNVRKGR